MCPSSSVSVCLHASTSVCLCIYRGKVRTKEGPVKSGNIAVLSVTCPILLRGLTAHTHHCGIRRGLDLVLETEVGVAMLSCAVEACIRF